MGEVGIYKKLVRILKTKIGKHVFATMLEPDVLGLALILLSQCISRAFVRRAYSVEISLGS